MKIYEFEVWREINEYARHWETLVFDNAKNYFTVVAIAFAGAGAALSWSMVQGQIQKIAVIFFLAAALLVSVLAIITLRSQRNYLGGFYERRRELEKENNDLRLREDTKNGSTGSSIASLISGFGLAIILSAVLIVVTINTPPRALLAGSKLQGADLSAVQGLRQSDLDGACGDSLTKLPTDLAVKQCGDASSIEQSTAGKRRAWLLFDH